MVYLIENSETGMAMPFSGEWPNVLGSVSSMGEIEPVPGQYYQIQRGQGGLLSVVGKAYDEPAGVIRLKLAQKVNDHPRNRKYWVKPTSSFAKRYFPKGIISFRPIFGCSTGTSKCYAKIWIPLIKDWRRITPDHVRRLLKLCPNKKDPIGMIGQDNRKSVINTTMLPNRWICKLFFIYSYRPAPFSVQATGFLLSNRQLVTAAHVMQHKVHGAPDFVVVIPGFNGSASNRLALNRRVLPFGAFVVSRKESGGVSNFRMPREWRDAKQAGFDYAVINFANAKQLFPGSPADAWNTVSPMLASVAALQKTPAQMVRLLRSQGRRGLFTAGYPGDFPCQQKQVNNGMFLDFDLPEASDHNVVTHRMDTIKGTSGSPVWIQRRVKGNKSGLIRTQRLLVGIVESGIPLKHSPSKSTQTLPNTFTLITPAVLKRLLKPSLLVGL